MEQDQVELFTSPPRTAAPVPGPPAWWLQQFPPALVDDLSQRGGLYLASLGEDLDEVLILGHHEATVIRETLVADEWIAADDTVEQRRCSALVIGPCRHAGGEVLVEFDFGVPQDVPGAFPCTRVVL